MKEVVELGDLLSRDITHTSGRQNACIYSSFYSSENKETYGVIFLILSNFAASGQILHVRTPATTGLPGPWAAAQKVSASQASYLPSP